MFEERRGEHVRGEERNEEMRSGCIFKQWMKNKRRYERRRRKRGKYGEEWREKSVREEVK